MKWIHNDRSPGVMTGAPVAYKGVYTFFLKMRFRE